MTDREAVRQLVPMLLLRVMIFDIREHARHDRRTWRYCLEIDNRLGRAIDELGIGGGPEDKLRRRGARIAKDVSQHIAGCDFGALILAYRLLILRLIEPGRAA